MITVNVKLFGTLPQRFAGYDKKNGLSVTLEPGAKIADLTDKLNISSTDAGVVATEGHVAKPDQQLTNGACVQIFQRLYGG
jgi:sulfur carrier protein ThiS